MEIALLLFAIVVALFIIAFSPVYGLGLVVISEKEVGIVIKRFSRKGDLPHGRLVALKGEAGYQADTLAPGWHWGYYRWQYQIQRVPVIVVPQGEVALVVAADGTPMSPDHILGREVECDNYQDARAFLANGGERGRQRGILTAGTYRINLALFTVIRSVNAHSHGMTPEQLKVFRIQEDRVGIVTTLDGHPIDEGEIAGDIIPGHESFQKVQEFIDGGGRRGLQQQVLLSGSWNLNPWFVQVEQIAMTEIPIGYVGVVISYVGDAPEDLSGESFMYGDLVHQGQKGVWAKPLYPGKHPINNRVMSVELVPTINIVLNWANRTETHTYDSSLKSITVLSNDGFAFNLDVSQIIHVAAMDAPKVISRVGSVQNLVDHVLEPIVGNYFRNAAQAYTVLDFLSARSERQHEATRHIRTAIELYDVQAIDTLIGDINPPSDLMATLTDRKIAQEQKKTYEMQQIAQAQRQLLVRETSLADIQNDMVRAEKGVHIADLEAQAGIARAKGDAEAIRARGQANADTYSAGVKAIGADGYTMIQIMRIIGEQNVRVVPDVTVSGNNGSASVSDALLGMLLRSQMGNPTPPPVDNGATHHHEA